MQVPLIRLQCGVNSYDWGKVGAQSAAARYAAATPSNKLEVEPEMPYAELWMGTHPKQPSKDVETQRTLLDMVQDNQSLMSQDIGKKYGSKLPFLFKVLSIRKALSIQAHPNKKLAEKLHREDPQNYPDDNHKPEMTIAITPFDGLCGFRPLKEIAHFLSTVPTFRELVGETEAAQFERAVENQRDERRNKEALRSAFSTLMKNEKAVVTTAAKKLVASAEKEGESFAGGGGPSNGGKELADLLIRCNSQFEGDIGLFVLFFLNYVKLEVGEAMFLKADDIHAYLSGDIIECMASSDNVVRAGFTPKFQDIQTLTTMLTYDHAPISEQKMTPIDYHNVKLNQVAYTSSSSARLYNPPIEEFAVIRTELKEKGAKAAFEAIEGPSIIICTEGLGTISVGPKTEAMEEGFVYFVGATAGCVLESQGNHFTTFKAFCEMGTEEPVNGANGYDGTNRNRGLS